MAKKKKKEKKYTKFEKARMIGSRALQIASGAPLLIEMTEEELEEIKYRPLEIAKREFAQGKIPITVKRPYPDTREKAKQK
ncbi:DNA-directed RNA polymerase subunit K [Candidatus Woesearchaeota archaeon]|nr:DNA-directed RNA polymerase subunit K [Candidatus Woesearchaeota archaeon]